MQSVETVDNISVNRQRQVPRTDAAQWQDPGDVRVTHVPMIQKVQKTVGILQVPHVDKVIEVPQAQLIGEAVEVPENMQRHDPMIQNIEDIQSRSHLGSSYGMPSDPLRSVLTHRALMADLLVVELHGRLLSRVSSKRHCQGLGVAARDLLRSNVLLGKVAKRRQFLDTAYSVCRHTTLAYAISLYDEVDACSSNQKNWTTARFRTVPSGTSLCLNETCICSPSFAGPQRYHSRGAWSLHTPRLGQRVSKEP